MPGPIRFRCPGCKARIKAPAQMLGQHRSCPGCGHGLIVGPSMPSDAGPLLVADAGPRLVWRVRARAG